jgi:DNA-binding SARP family transcriptional activator
MSRLALYLLGPPLVERDGEAVHISRRKAMALLAYLAVTGRPHRRDALATLLSPDYEQSGALRELRRTLSVLNAKLGNGWLVADREKAELNPDADLWLDVHAFRQHLSHCETRHPPTEVCQDCVLNLEKAVELYRDDFLAGFTLTGSLAFDEWQFFQTERLKDQLAGALERLAHALQSQGEHERAIGYVRRWLELDPTHEPAHRQLMGLYVQAGRRNAALRQYRTCVRVLEQELGVPPSRETTTLYEQVRSQRAGLAQAAVPQITPPARVPAFLTQEEAPAIDRPVFVARERELARLDGYLEKTLGGQGQVVLVRGGPGRGKTALMREFAWRAMEAHPDLLVASGACNAYSGVGDPYLPFREVMDVLTGDVEGRWAAGALSREHARRLWKALPATAQVLLDHGPNLINTMVPGRGLLSRVTSLSRREAVSLITLQRELKGWVERERGEPSDLEQTALFTQFTNVLRALSGSHPLLLMLDDVQWADTASISLLFHLGRRLDGARILVVGAYRPEEVTKTRDGNDHPLREVLSELKRELGDTWINLSQTSEDEGRRFVEVLLDVEPNRLGEEFRERLYQRTGGHPLFTVELLRGMRERGDLVWDEDRRAAGDPDGVWVEGPSLDWEALPARVEAVIEKRVNRVDEDLRDLLAVASVEGEGFTAQVMAQVQSVPEREVLKALALELGARHRLVRDEGETQVGGRFLSRYRFAHALFQEYLYDDLSAGERRLLHGEVAVALELLYGAQRDQMAASLAHHFRKAGHTTKAITYAVRAGDQAPRAHAKDEAAAHYESALALLDATDFDASVAAIADEATSEPPEKGANEWRLGVLRGLGQVRYWTGKAAAAEAHFREAITLAQRLGLAPRELVRLYFWLGEVLLHQYRADDASRNAREGLALLGEDVESVEGVLMYKHLGTACWLKGEPESGAEYVDRVADFIESLPYTEELRTAYLQVSFGRALMREKNVDEAERLRRVLEGHALRHRDLRALGAVYVVAASILSRTGDGRGAVGQIKRVVQVFEKSGDPFVASSFRVELGKALLALGDLPTPEAYARDVLADGGRPVVTYDPVATAGAFHQLLGTVLLCQGAVKAAADAFRSALQFSGDKLIPLRVDAMLGLGRALLVQERREEAIRKLQEAAGLALQRSAPWAKRDRPVIATVFGLLDEAYGDAAAFRAFCQRLREKALEIGDWVSETWGMGFWFLEAAEAQVFPRCRARETFAETLAEDWVWHDPFGDCAYALAPQGGLEIRAANLRDLWHVNRSAPRLLRPVPAEGDFAIQTLCGPATVDKPAIGGLLLWKDEENYLRLDRGLRGADDIVLECCVGNRDLALGRGRLQVDGTTKRVFLRLERAGGTVRALCSADGAEWFTLGSMTFPAQGTLWVGLQANGCIDRIIYPGAHPGGTAMRFESFEMWGRE